MMIAVISILTVWYLAMAYLTFFVLTKSDKYQRDWRVIVAAIFWPVFWLVVLAASLFDAWRARAYG